MRIDNEFTVSVPIDQAWAVLTDLEGIAPCMPGAQLTGVDGDVYSGKVRIKVGPVVSEYAGTARFVEKDDADHRAVIDARGRDSRGAGNASALVTARLRADGTRTVVTVGTDLRISGKIAQFGNGMIKEISGKLLGRFVDCLEGKLAGEVPRDTGEAGAPLPETERAGAAPSSTPPSSTPPSSTAAQAGTVLPETNGVVAAPRETVAAPQETVATSREKVDAEPLDVMSIAGGSVYKRALPVVVVLILAVAIAVYLVVS